MSGFVYIWYDRKHKRFYVGSHWGAEDDGYICSSSWMKQAYRHRPQDFKRRILARIGTSRAELLTEEQRWIDMIKPEERKRRYYNLTLSVGHWHGMGDKRYNEICKKISAKNSGVARAGTWKDPEARSRKISDSLKSTYAKRKSETGCSLLPSQLEAVRNSALRTQKTIERNQKSWNVTLPNGEKIFVTNLSKWCRENGVKNVMNLRSRGYSGEYRAERIRS